MENNSSQSLRNFFLFIFYLYCVAGIYGTAWISDEFDTLRIKVVSYVGVPLLFLFALFNWYYPKWWYKWPYIRTVSIGVMVIVFLWGNLLLLNAVGGLESDVLVAKKMGKLTALNIKEHRGAVGNTFRYRW